MQRMVRRNRAFVEALGKPVYAECGGMIYLGLRADSRR